MKEPLGRPVYVTQPALPPLNEFIGYLEEIWNSKTITNNGPFHQRLEKELADYLGVKYVSLFANGTVALMVALQALEIKGEVITTPFSFVATANALWWNRINPVFADIEPEYLNIDPERLEEKINENTTAILPVHVYGNPCNNDRICEIAAKHKLKVVYDSAHAFGVKVNGSSVLNYGDLSVLSFHATKVFNTVEGGAIVSHNAEMKKRIDLLKNFGFADEVTVVEAGINGKMNELQAAYGLIQIKRIDDIIKLRKECFNYYLDLFQNQPGIKIIIPDRNTDYNYNYFPIIVDKQVFGEDRDSLYTRLKQDNIFSRRYFYPLISTFNMYSELESAYDLPVASKLAEAVLCLPLYSGLSKAEIERIVMIILKKG